MLGIMISDVFGLKKSVCYSQQQLTDIIISEIKLRLAKLLIIMIIWL